MFDKIMSSVTRRQKQSGKEIHVLRPHALRESWLLLHDVQTGGIPGLLPLCAEMPVKLTDNICRDEKISEHTVGRLKEIVLSEAMAAQVGESIPSTSGQVDAREAHPPAAGHEELRELEIIPPGLPGGFVVEVAEGHAEPHMHFLKPETVTWHRNKFEQAPVRRRGFQLAPDFAGTAHAYCGDTLEKSEDDFLERQKLPTLEMMQRSYIIRSPVQSIDKCMIVRPYLPVLFNQGTLPGPELLLQRQRGKLTAKALKDK